MSLLSGWEAGCKLRRINFKSTGQYFRFLSTGHGRSSPSLNLNPQELIEEKGDAFYVVRKGNHVGLYRSLSDCQSQICDHPVSVYKGYLLKKEAEKYLASRGLKNAVYSLNSKDLKEDLFEILVPCPFQEPTVASPVADLPEKISVITDEPVKEHLKLKDSSKQKQLKKHLKLKHSSKQKQLSDNSVSFFF
ncbi:hypothetical protein BHE74_00046708 [Ensete ventricosum]|nr:hypothetical protein BHE74_00046708 [Ensete ventricosum]